MTHKFEKYDERDNRVTATSSASTRRRCCRCGMRAYYLKPGGRNPGILTISDLNNEIDRQYWQQHVDVLSCEDVIIMSVIT